VSRSARAGLVVFGVLSVVDLLGPLLTDGQHPPMAVALAGAVIGLASLLLVVAAWRGASRAVIPLVVLRVLSALSALPAFFGSGVPAAVVAFAAAGIVATGVGAVLVLRDRQRTTAGAR